MLEPDAPPAVPENIASELRRFLEEELAKLALIINHLIQYNEDNP